MKKSEVIIHAKIPEAYLEHCSTEQFCRLMSDRMAFEWEDLQRQWLDENRPLTAWFVDVWQPRQRAMRRARRNA